MANLNRKTTFFTVLTIFIITRAWTLPTSNRIRTFMPQFNSNNSDSQPSEQPTMNTPQNKEKGFIIYSSTNNRPTTSKLTSDSNMITAQVTESTEIDRKPSENESYVELSAIKVEYKAPTQDSVKEVLNSKESSVESKISKTLDTVQTQPSVESVSEHIDISVAPLVTIKVEESAPTQSSVESVLGHEESSIDTSFTNGQVPVSTEQSLKPDSEHEKNPLNEQMESTKIIESTIAPVTTIVEDKEEALTTKPPNSASSSCISPPVVNETTEQPRTKSCFPDLNLSEIYSDNVTNIATNLESSTENIQETTTIRLCGTCNNPNHVENNKSFPENHPTTAPKQSTTIIDFFSTSTESSIQLKFSTVTDPRVSATKTPSILIETTKSNEEFTQQSTSQMKQPIEMITIISQSNVSEMSSEPDPNGSTAAIKTATTIESETNGSNETTTIKSQTTLDLEITTQNNLNSNASMLISYHVLKHLTVLCAIIIFKQCLYGI